MKVIAPISWAAGIYSADKLVLVKHVGSEGGSVFYKPAGQQVWGSGGWMCYTDTYHTGVFGFIEVNVVLCALLILLEAIPV